MNVLFSLRVLEISLRRIFKPKKGIERAAEEITN
jgi:hypothetical protein